MDLTQLHLVNKLAIVSIVWLFAINWSLTAELISALIKCLVPERYYVTIVITFSAVTTLAAYIIIACAVIRFIYSLFWS